MNIVPSRDGLNNQVCDMIGAINPASYLLSFYAQARIYDSAPRATRDTC
jgi:hypothetical protein